MKVSIIMGSISDEKIAKKSVDILNEFQVPYDVEVISAHRTPQRALEFTQNAEANGTEVIIAIAGKEIGRASCRERV